MFYYTIHSKARGPAAVITDSAVPEDIVALMAKKAYPELNAPPDCIRGITETELHGTKQMSKKLLRIPFDGPECASSFLVPPQNPLKNVKITIHGNSLNEKSVTKLKVPEQISHDEGTLLYALANIAAEYRSMPMAEVTSEDITSIPKDVMAKYDIFPMVDEMAIETELPPGKAIIKQTQ